MKILKYIIILFLFIIIGCSHQSKQKNNDVNTIDSISINVDSTKYINIGKITSEDSIEIMNSNYVKKLEEEIINKGDQEAYDKLYIFIMQFEFGKKPLLPYALIMAEKYNYPIAYFDVFSIYINDIYPKTKDNKDLNKGLGYLYRAADLEESNALRDLGFMHLKGEYVEKDSILSRKYFEKLGIDLNEPKMKRLMKNYYERGSNNDNLKQK